MWNNYIVMMDVDSSTLYNYQTNEEKHFNYSANVWADKLIMYKGNYMTQISTLFILSYRRIFNTYKIIIGTIY